jgi:capsular polysaccharide biosynthesis protein
MPRVVLNTLTKWFWLVVVVTVLTAVVSYVLFQQQPTTYRSSARLLVGPSTSSQNPALDDLRTSGQLLETYAALATTRPTLEIIIAELGLDLSPSELEEQIEIGTTPETQIMSVRAFAQDPDLAIAIVNAITARILTLSPSTAEIAPDDPYRSLILDQIARLEGRIANSEELVSQLQENLLTATTREERIAILNNILQESGRLSETERFLVTLYDDLQRSATNRIEIVEPATEAQRVDPQTSIKTIIAGMAGFLWSVAMVVGLAYFNDTIADPDDVEIPGRVTMLSTLYKPARPKPGFTIDSAGRTKFDWKILEPYHALAARIQPLLAASNGMNGHGSAGKTLLVTGTPDNGEVAEIIANLSVVLTQMGLSVIVVDANYGGSRVSNLFKLGKNAGLSEAVADEETPAPLAIEGIRGLAVLPSGRRPASSFSLVASESMTRTIDLLKSSADVILVAAPDLSSSETVVLASKVDGVILVAFGGRSQRANIDAGIDSLSNIVGVIFVEHTTGLRRLLGQRASV